MFNLFCPFILAFNVFWSLIIIILFTLALLSCLLKTFLTNSSKGVVKAVTTRIFPSESFSLSVFFSGFLCLALLNLISMVCYSYPVTTTLSFNLRVALLLWIIRVLFLVNKKNNFASLLPGNSPWYLSSFLSVVEAVSLLVRPVTLCFRLLANLRAGHILLSLICKLPLFTWLLRGVLFGLLELLVAIVQSFVFLILVRVYLEERFSH